MTEPKIKAIAPWYGGKRTLAPEIVRELGRHRSYWDLMCGSLAVLFAKPRSTQEHGNDLHRDVINLARVLADERLADRLHQRCLRVLHHETFFRESQTILSGRELPDSKEPDLDRAYHFLIVSWMGRNGLAGTKRGTAFALRWTPGGGAGGTRWAAAADSIPPWHERLRRVTFTSRDVFAILPSIDDVDGVAIYADPPYLPESRTGGDSRYKHEFAPGDHKRLAEALSRFSRARVVLSYYDNPRLDELYGARWTKRTLYRNKNLHIQNQRRAQPAIAPEVLLLNGPSYAESDHERKLF